MGVAEKLGRLSAYARHPVDAIRYSYREGMKEKEPAKQTGDEAYERATGAKKTPDALYEKATGARQVHEVQQVKPKQAKQKVVYMQPRPPVDFAMINENIAKGSINTISGIANIDTGINRYNSRIANYNSNFNSGLGNIDKNLDEYNKRMKRLFG